MKRILFVVIRALPILCLVAIVGLFVAFGLHLFADLRGWIGITLNSNGTSTDVYQAMSGFIPAMAILGLLGGVVSAYRMHVCAHGPCWRWSKHTTKDGYRLCRKHVAWPVDRLALHEVHPDHR